MIKKAEFIFLVVEVLKKNPEWFGDLVMAMQSGLSLALSQERQEKGDMAAGFVTLLLDSKKAMEKNRHQLQNVLKTLYKYYGTAPCGETIRQYIDNEPN